MKPDPHYTDCMGTDCRSPRGERGLKHDCDQDGRAGGESLPARGAWIETACPLYHLHITTRRSPRGERGLKPRHPRPRGGVVRVAPRAGSVD